MWVLVCVWGVGVFVCEHVVYVGVLCVWKIAGILLQERTMEKNVIAYNVTVLQTTILRKKCGIVYIEFRSRKKLRLTAWDS
jgi:hypothetical protein